MGQKQSLMRDGRGVSLVRAVRQRVEFCRYAGQILFLFSSSFIHPLTEMPKGRKKGQIVPPIQITHLDLELTAATHTVKRRAITYTTTHPARIYVPFRLFGWRTHKPLLYKPDGSKSTHIRTPVFCTVYNKMVPCTPRCVRVST